VPYHDKRLWKIFIQWLKDIKPDRIVINGDFWDMYELSSFVRMDRDNTFLSELDMGRRMIEEDLLPICSRIDFVQGNHEERYKRFIMSKAPELWGLPGLEFEEVTELNRMGIKYHKLKLQLGKLLITHGTIVRQKSAYTANGMLLIHFKNLLMGHTHRVGSSAMRTDDHTICAWEGGCMVDMESIGTEYIKSGVPNWQHGWTYIELNEPTGVFALTPIHVAKDYTFISQGKLYKG
jgi:predicted phosphodiesterase